VFNSASVFNQDVSKWKTGAVTNMWNSKCTLSLPLFVAMPSTVVVVLNTTTQVSSDHNSDIRFIILFFILKRYLFVVCGGLIFLLFVALSLVVFNSASAFNQDVSNWNTGAVTTMAHSKCTLPPPLCGHAFRCCVFEF
jgi:surface protein